jgi:endonuclease/exonuclease/phosphatase family metal-dependent hydrolase
VVLLASGLAVLAVLRESSSSQRTQAGRIPETSPFHSPAACEAAIRARARRAPRGPRIGTWNVRWFPYGTADRKQPGQRTDLGWLACAIASLDVDLLAVQEFVQDAGGRSALAEVIARLDALTGGRWGADFDDCPGEGFQHVGLLFDSRRVELQSARTLAALNPGRSACDRSLRPGFGAYARFAGGGPDLYVVALHLDSGTTARDFSNRARSLPAISPALAELSRGRPPDRDVLVLGDFNNMGCSDCTPSVGARSELERVEADLAALGLRRLAAPAQHACSQYYRGKAGALDHIAASVGMEELAQQALVEAHGPCRDLECGPAARGEDVDAWQHLSDHCPLVIELTARDRDP